MTTLPEQKNAMLFEAVKSVVLDHEDTKSVAILHLLQDGADPNAIIERNMSAYSLTMKNNSMGQFNPLIEEFDFFYDKLRLRENDSTYEGLEGKIDE